MISRDGRWKEVGALVLGDSGLGGFAGLQSSHFEATRNKIELPLLCRYIVPCWSLLAHTCSSCSPHTNCLTFNLDPCNSTKFWLCFALTSSRSVYMSVRSTWQWLYAAYQRCVQNKFVLKSKPGFFDERQYSEIFSPLRFQKWQHYQKESDFDGRNEDPNIGKHPRV